MEEKKGPSSFKLLGRLLQQARPYWLHLGAILLLSLLATPFTLLNPLPLKIIVDNVVGAKALTGHLASLIPESVAASGQGLLILAVEIMVAVAVLSQIRSLGSRLLATYTGQKLVLAFRARLFRHVQRLSFSYHDEKGTADSTYRIQYDADCVKQIFIGTAIPLLRSGFSLVGMISVTAFIDWQLTVIALAVAPILVILVRFFGWRMKAKWKTVKALDSSSMSIVQESLSALRVIKAFGKEDDEEDRLVQRSEEKIRSQMDAVRINSMFKVLVRLTITLATASVFYVGTLHVQAGLLSMGELTTVRLKVE